ncbi:MAG: hypothetical protein JNK14_13055 [Chitinophagaceae bacterium]|nr:hypothetical protein [Chitinophagaceae bacterium]
MKKTVLLFSLLFSLVLAGCFETTDELTLNKDGSGVLTSTNDMSMIISMAKSMGGSDAMGDEKPTDTTVSLDKMADSLTSLTAEEKELVKKGKLGLTLNMADEKMITRLEIPFSKPEQVDKIKGISSKITNYFLGKNMGDNMPPGLGDKMPSSDPVGDYYITSYSPGVIEKKLNKEKYAGLESDEIMKGVKEVADNGLPMSNTIVINLPSPAKSVTGKKITLSEDKKKVTIKSSAEDFFGNATDLEFRIEY